MLSFGERLRSEREARNRTIEEMGVATGVELSYLAALERNEFDALPGRAFGKLYIRAYAEILGLDPRPLIDQYDREQQRQPRATTAPTPAAREGTRRAGSRVSDWRPARRAASTRPTRGGASTQDQREGDPRTPVGESQDLPIDEHAEIDAAMPLEGGYDGREAGQQDEMSLSDAAPEGRNEASSDTTDVSRRLGAPPGEIREGSQSEAPTPERPPTDPTELRHDEIAESSQSEAPTHEPPTAEPIESPHDEITAIPGVTAPADLPPPADLPRRRTNDALPHQRLEEPADLARAIEPIETPAREASASRSPETTFERSVPLCESESPEVERGAASAHGEAAVVLPSNRKTGGPRITAPSSRRYLAVALPILGLLLVAVSVYFARFGRSGSVGALASHAPPALTTTGGDREPAPPPIESPADRILSAPPGHAASLESAVPAGPASPPAVGPAALPSRTPRPTEPSGAPPTSHRPTETSAPASAEALRAPASGRAQAAERAQSPRLSVSEFGVGRRIVNRRLEGEDERFTVGEVAFFSTRILGGTPGDHVRHVWIRDGRTVQSTTLPIRGPDWRTYSRKTLGEAGSWEVQARDEQGRVLARAVLTSAPPGP